MLGSSYGIGLFSGTVFIVDFFLQTFHLIRGIRKRNHSFNSITVSSSKGLDTRRRDGVVLDSNPEFGFFSDYILLFPFPCRPFNQLTD